MLQGQKIYIYRKLSTLLSFIPLYSVHDLVKRINSHNNQLRSTPFIGQSGAQGLKQKKQLETVVEFKKGTFNVLVATCVGEEGLDIG